MNHTPTPWRKSEDRKGRASISTVLMGEPGAKDICRMEYGEHLADHHDANFIVTACNAHEELVKVLKRLCIHLDPSLRRLTDTELKELLAEAKEALAKAGVQP